jgi:signal transduction histidine kinase
MAERDRQRDAAHIAAHELRHDVQVAYELLDELLADEREGGAHVRQLTQRLRRSLERLEADIDRLLLDAGGDLDTLRREPTNLGQLVMRVVHAHPTGHQPVDVSAADVLFNLDPVKVERILDNLLANALVHTPDDCPIRVIAEVEPGGATLVVEDEGPGLSDAQRERLLAIGDEPPVEGGMGLWIVVRFARLHGGDVRIEQPASGRGARFTVWLPAQGS